MNIEKAKEEIQQLADKLKAALDEGCGEWPQVGDWYWTIDMGLRDIHQPKWYDSEIHCFRKTIGWIWCTEAEAQSHLDMLQATERVRSYIAKANGDWVADFKNSQQMKATWEYGHDVRRLMIAKSWAGQRADTWRYIKPELGDQLIEDCVDDILLIMGVEDA